MRLKTLPSSCTVVVKSGNLNFLEHSGPLQACNGTALPLPLPLMYHWNLTHFRYIDTHFMTSHRFMSEGFGIHLMLLKLQLVQYEYISSVSKIEGKTFAAY